MVYKIEIGTPVDQIDTPALLVDYDALCANINQMAAFFAEKTAVLRPHIKSHKCPQIARLQLEAGAVGITCAKVSEAEVFAQAGVLDILIANQITGEVKIDRLTDLAKTCDVKVAVDDPANVEDLDRFCQMKGIQLGVLVEVDLGMARCGVQPGEDTLRLVKNIISRPNLKFEGLQAYEGHLVLIKDPEQRAEKVIQDFAALKKTCLLLTEADFEPRIISGGGTGTFDISGTQTPLTEIQVGSYVFMDQTYLAVRPDFQSSITVLSTVVSRPVPERLVTDTGLKSMTSEFGWPTLLGGYASEMQYLSEEHAVLTLLDPAEVHLVGGDKVRFIPSHVCTTVNLHDNFYVHQNGKLIDIWPISARGCTQ